MSGDRIGKYTIVEKIGSGAMGIVYKAIDPYINRIVAIKTIRFDVTDRFFDQNEAIQRFIREAQAAGKLSHPNIITIYDIGKDQDLTYIAMQYIDGSSLEDILVSRKRLLLEEKISLISQAGDALDYAHREGIIHRDIKPGNILIDREGVVHLVDFGIARLPTSTLTQTGISLGTPSYMSPEQIAGKKVDHTADIFSLGGVLYEILTHEKPFPGESFTTVVYKIMNEEPLSVRTFNAELPEGLDYVVRKALAKAPKARYQSCRELTEDLINYSTPGGAPFLKEVGTGEEAAEKQVFSEYQKEKKKNPLLIILAAMMALIAITVGAVLLYVNISRDSEIPTFAGGTSASFPPVSKTQTPPEQKTEPDKPKDVTPSLPTTTETAVETTDKPPSKEESKFDLAARLDEGLRAYNQRNYNLSIQLMQEILKKEPGNPSAQYYLAEAKKKVREQEVKIRLKKVREAYERGDYTECTRQAQAMLEMDPNNAQAKEYLEFATLKITQSQVNAIVREYVQSLENGTLSEFYRRHCSTELYWIRKAGAEGLFNDYTNIKIAVSKISFKVKNISTIEVSFSRVLTGTLRSGGSNKVLSEGTVKWDMQSREGEWQIFDIKDPL